jgi:hypothetical protein
VLRALSPDCEIESNASHHRDGHQQHCLKRSMIVAAGTLCDAPRDFIELCCKLIAAGSQHALQFGLGAGGGKKLEAYGK